MSEIILNWLNEQIQLSKRISNFQQDFGNGYLLGELLSKYNQQLNFNQFLDKQDKKSKLKNFQLLFDTFASLRVTFNSSIANDIINKKSGIIKKLLYELKMNLQKTSSNAFTKLTKMTKTLSPLKKIKLSKQQYDKVDKQHFMKQLNELHPAQKTLNQQKLLKRFSDFHQNQISVNNQLADKDVQQKNLEQKKFRQRQRQNLKKTADFRNEWQRSNVQKWETNMTVRHMQQQKDSMFRTKLQQTKIQNKTMSELNAIKLLDKDINQFEKKFIKGNNKKKIPIDDSDDSGDDVANNTISEEPELKKQESKLSSKLKFTSTGNPQLSFDSPSKKKKTAVQVPQQQKHQREKKRRKMIVEQNKRYQLIEVSRRQKYILSTIQQTSKQQKQLEYEIWRVWQNKQIIKENKTLEQDKVKEKSEVRQINAKFKRQELLKTYRQEHQAEVKEACSRQEKLIKDHQVAQRKQVYSQCKNILEQFINVTEKCFLAQQQNNMEQMSKDLLDHLFSEFVQGSQSKEEVVKLEIDNYIHGRGEWNLPVKRKAEDQPTDPTLENALPNKIINNYILGNTLRFLYEKKFTNQNNKKSQEQAGQGGESQPRPEFLFSLLGLEFAGKHLAAKELTKKHNFALIEIEKLIMKKLQEYEEIKEKVTEISSTTKQLVQLAYGGKNIPNQLIIQLIKQEIAKNARSILINFPTTYNQALELTKTLANVQPSDFIRKSPLQQKIQSFSRLVWPNQSKTVPKPVRQCGVDLTLWIDINQKTSYDRFLGRRWIDNKVVHISDDVAVQVNKLQVRDKASPQIYKNYEKKVQKTHLQEFFNQFGIQLNPQHKKPQQVEEFREGQRSEKPQTLQDKKSQVIKSWSTVDGHCSIEKLQRQVLSKFEQTIEFKNLKKEELRKEEQVKKQDMTKLEQLKRAQEETKMKCVFSTQQQIQGKLVQAINSVSLDEKFVNSMLSIWETIETSTINSLTQTFIFLSSQQKQQQNYFSSTKRNFINLLTRQDKKFSIVKEFQINYNKFFDENKEMISQDYTKQELHQRVDDLEETLFDIIEMKKQDAIQEKKSTNESGWIECQLEQFYNCVRILLQAELNRYNASEKILSDFYSKKYAVPQQPFQQASTEIPYDSTLEMITKEGNFPRLEKLISEAIRIFNKEEEAADDKNKKGGKAPPAKKDDKKGGKKNQVQQVRQATPEQLEMKRAINIEKSILRYRVSIINEFSLRKMSSLYKANQSLFKDLESYYQYTYEIENKCIFNLSKIFRTKIQQQLKIQNQVQLHYVDIVENELIRNFEFEKPIILPAKQQPHPQRFTIANIWELMHFLQHQAQSKQKISTKRLLQLFKHLQTNPNEKEIFPSNWKLLSPTQIQEFVLKLDIEQTGSVLLWRIFVFVVMSDFRLPSQKQLENYFNELTSFGAHQEVNKQKLVATAAWFDQVYEQKENVRTFRRNEQVKEILFEVLKHNIKGQECVLIEELVNSLGLKWWDSNRSETVGTNYFFMAFPGSA